MTNVEYVYRPHWPQLGLSGAQNHDGPQPTCRFSPLAGDSVSGACFGPQQTGESTGLSGPYGQVFQQLFSMLRQMVSALGGLLGMPGSSSQTYFTSADGNSVGDPHCSFNGATANGTQTTHFESMTPHSDLLDSDSFFGGFRISTQTTQPDANGVAYNSRASVTTNFGGTSVWMDKDGHAGVNNNGQFTAVQNGQTIDLGNGEVVTRAADGTLTLTETNASGGSVETTMRLNGRGVDVTARAQNVRLGGDLVTGNTRPAGWQAQWV